MTPLDRLTVWIVILIAAFVFARAVTREIVRWRDARRANARVRAAFVQLAGEMRKVHERSRRKWDMPWQDRMQEAQAGQLVGFGIAVDPPTASAKP